MVIAIPKIAGYTRIWSNFMGYTGCQEFVPFEADYHDSEDEVKRNNIVTTHIAERI